MTEHRPAVDVEALLVDYLANDAEIVDEIGPRGVSTDLPADFARAPDGRPARLRITRLGGAPDARDGAQHVDFPRVQVDAFASSSTAASTLARLAHARLKRLPFEGYVFPGAEVTDVRTSIAPRRLRTVSEGVAAYMLEVILTVAPVAE